MNKEIKTWIGKHVRIKREYLKAIPIFETDEYGNEVATDMEYNIELPDGTTDYGLCALRTCTLLSDKETLWDKVYTVNLDFYGVDLYHTRENTRLDSLEEPTHQLIFSHHDTGYPYAWNAKYFEIVERKEIWVAVKNK